MESQSTSKTINIFNNSCLDIAQRRNKILTGHKGLDTHFGGGIGLGQITELIGTSGTGKTQLWWDLDPLILINWLDGVFVNSMQLCLNVQIPKSVGGLEGAALFIDSRQDFNPDRLLGEMTIKLGSLPYLISTYS